MDAPVSAKAALLQVLLEGPGHCFALIQRVRDRTQGVLVLGEGSVYPALKALERARLVTGRDEGAPVDRGGRPRRVYTVTAMGRRFALDHREQIARLFGPTDDKAAKKGGAKR